MSYFLKFNNISLAIAILLHAYNKMCSVVTVPVSAITGLRLVVEVFPEVI